MLDSRGTTSDTAAVLAGRQLAQVAYRRRLLADLRRRRRPLVVPPLPACPPAGGPEDE